MSVDFQINNQRLKKELEKWMNDKKSNLNLIDVQENILFFKLGKQEFKLAVPENYPDQGGEGIIMLDYNKVEDNYEWLSSLQDHIIDHNLSFLKTIRLIERKSKTEKSTNLFISGFIEK